MIKMVFLLKRNPALDRATFFERYENGHVVLGEKYLREHAVHYVRRYCRPLEGSVEDGPELPADVITEVWFPDQAAYEAAMAALATEEAVAEVGADEDAMFDRSKMVGFFVDEYESEFSKEAGEHA